MMNSRRTTATETATANLPENVAAVIALAVVVVGGFLYALLEAVAGVDRLTAAVPATVGAMTWMFSWTWIRVSREATAQQTSQDA